MHPRHLAIGAADPNQQPAYGEAADLVSWIGDLVHCCRPRPARLDRHRAHARHSGITKVVQLPSLMFLRHSGGERSLTAGGLAAGGGGGGGGASVGARGGGWG